MTNNRSLGINWRRSSRCTGGGNDCVEVHLVGDVVEVRSSSSPTGPVLAFDQQSWREFISSLRYGDLPGIALEPSSSRNIADA